MGGGRLKTNIFYIRYTWHQQNTIAPNINENSEFHRANKIEVYANLFIQYEVRSLLKKVVLFIDFLEN